MPPQSPLLRTAAHYAVRYGPIALAVAQQARGPAQDAARRAWETHRGQRLADDHARTLRRGSVLAVVHQGQRHWIVFAGDEPVVAYPTPEVSMMTLMTHADLELRRPPAPPRSPRLRRGARGSTARGEQVAAGGASPAGDAGSGEAPVGPAGTAAPVTPEPTDPQHP